MDNDGFISNGELFQVLKMMVGNNLKETQLQQIVDKTVLNADKDGDGKISFDEFCAVSMRFFFSVSCNFGELFVLCESDFSHPDHHHTRQTTDTPGLKPFTSFSEFQIFVNSISHSRQQCMQWWVLTPPPPHPKSTSFIATHK